MHCSKATRLVQLYIDQQLSLRQIRSLESHLSSCPSCRQELRLLQDITSALTTEEQVYEPTNFTTNVMLRIAQSEQEKKIALTMQSNTASFRPSMRELVTAILLATCVTSGILLAQPSNWASLSSSNAHSGLLLVLTSIWISLLNMNSSTLLLFLWIAGTFMGVWITLVLAGAEMRSQWLRAMMERLPVW